MKKLEYSLSRREREKQQRKSEIIDAAKKLFVKNGYEGTSMDDIAKESQFTKPTLYQYFVNKEDIFYAIVLKYSKLLISRVRAQLSEERNALENIYAGGRIIFEFYKENPEVFQLIYYTPASKPDKKRSPSYVEIQRFQGETLEMYTELIEEGKRDGSMSQKLDAKKAAHFGIHATISFMNTMSNTSDEYFDTYGFVKDDFILYGINMITDLLAPKNGQ